VARYTYHQFKHTPAGSNLLIRHFNKTYQGREEYVETVTQGKRDVVHEGSKDLYDSQTKTSYDANGNRTRIEENITDSRLAGTNQKVNARYMRFDAEGKLLSKVTGEQNHLLSADDFDTFGQTGDARTGEVIDWDNSVAQNVGFEEDSVGNNRLAGSYYIHSGGQYLGELSKSGINTIKDNHFSAPTSRDANIMARHTVLAGETKEDAADSLKSIAKQYYGSESLWYLIADANGIGLGSKLEEGSQLDIPARANQFNSHDSFKPMNLGDAIG
ncbi:LysM peptidoglycan-binding domain-containing protein, partial [Pseudoalteromonas holothuriae]|uniref:LysM peptidoglycan-binding domain-containing protein n=1 Tax=Pseudoalteromonas holothuriae TaxID=2963714 RepID=UPI0021C25389